jgi:hypothetical protein
MFTGIVKVKLSKLVQWEGDDIDVIDIDFGKMSPTTAIDAERACAANLSSAFMKATNTEYCAVLASYLMKWKHETSYRVLMKLNMSDFNDIWHTIGAYVLDQDPQEFYTRRTAGDEGDEMGFTKPAAKPEETE